VGGICLTTEEKVRNNLSQGSRRVLVYILHITKTPTQLQYLHIHTRTHYKTCARPHIPKPTHTHKHITKLYNEYGHSRDDSSRYRFSCFSLS